MKRRFWVILIKENLTQLGVVDASVKIVAKTMMDQKNDEQAANTISDIWDTMKAAGKSDDEIRNYLRGQKVTYCILNKSSAENIKRIADEKFTLSVLKTIGDEYIVEIEHGEAAP